MKIVLLVFCILYWVLPITIIWMAWTGQLEFRQETEELGKWSITIFCVFLPALGDYLAWKYYKDAKEGNDEE